MKGLSTAISAASIAWKARFLPVLFQAFSVIATILIQLEEYHAAYKMMDSIMPQVLECEDAYLTAQCFACLADGQVGLAGTKQGVSRNECLNKALNFIDRAFSGTSIKIIPDLWYIQLTVDRILPDTRCLQPKADDESENQSSRVPGRQGFAGRRCQDASASGEG